MNWAAPRRTQSAHGPIFTPPQSPAYGNAGSIRRQRSYDSLNPAQQLFGTYHQSGSIPTTNPLSNPTRTTLLSQSTVGTPPRRTYVSATRYPVSFAGWEVGQIVTYQNIEQHMDCSPPRYHDDGQFVPQLGLLPINTNETAAHYKLRKGIIVAIHQGGRTDQWHMSVLGLYTYHKTGLTRKGDEVKLQHMNFRYETDTQYVRQNTGIPEDFTIVMEAYKNSPENAWYPDPMTVVRLSAPVKIYFDSRTKQIAKLTDESIPNILYAFHTYMWYSMAPRTMRGTMIGPCKWFNKEAAPDPDESVQADQTEGTIIEDDRTTKVESSPVQTEKEIARTANANAESQASLTAQDLEEAEKEIERYEKERAEHERATKVAAQSKLAAEAKARRIRDALKPPAESSRENDKPAESVRLGKRERADESGDGDADVGKSSRRKVA
jgi:hypothetical protein